MVEVKPIFVNNFPLASAQSHFEKFGEPLVMIDDKVHILERAFRGAHSARSGVNMVASVPLLQISPIGIEGPEWIPDELNYTRVLDSPTKSHIEVSVLHLRDATLRNSLSTTHGRCNRGHLE